MRIVSITFPIIRYFPRTAADDHVVTFSFDDHPKWVTRPGRYPVRSWYIPGGILDSTGLHIPIVDTVSLPETRPWWAIFSEMFVGSTLGYKVQLKYGKPTQLSVDEFRKKFIGLLVKEKGFSRDIKEIKAATGYREIIAAQFGFEAVTRYDPPLTMEIEVPD